ncbi:MAG: hypothetical protein AAF517_27030 [Planctomycetota bacterium]
MSHSLEAFNAILRARDAGDLQFPRADIASIVRSAKIPVRLKQDIEDPGYIRPVLLRRSGPNCRLTIFDGGHEVVTRPAFEWLAKQRRK